MMRCPVPKQVIQRAAPQQLGPTENSPIDVEINNHHDLL